MAEIKQLLIYTPWLTVFSMTFLWSWKLHKCLNGLSKQLQRTFLVGQWIRICLPMQGTWVDPWSRKIPHLGIAQPVDHNYWAWALEPGSHNYWAYMPQQLKSPHPRAHAPQWEKPLQQEACTPPPAPTRQPEKAWVQQWRPSSVKS